MITCVVIISGSSQLKSNSQTDCGTPYPDPPTQGWTVSDFQNINDYPPNIQPCIGGWLQRIIDWLGLGQKGGGGNTLPYDWYNCWVTFSVQGKTCHPGPAGDAESLIAAHSCGIIQPCLP